MRNIDLSAWQIATASASVASKKSGFLDFEHRANHELNLFFTRIAIPVTDRLTSLAEYSLTGTCLSVADSIATPRAWARQVIAHFGEKDGLKGSFIRQSAVDHTREPLENCF